MTFDVRVQNSTNTSGKPLKLGSMLFPLSIIASGSRSSPTLSNGQPHDAGAEIVSPPANAMLLSPSKWVESLAKIGASLD